MSEELKQLELDLDDLDFTVGSPSKAAKLEVRDLYEQYRHDFSFKAQKAFETKFQNSILESPAIKAARQAWQKSWERVLARTLDDFTTPEEKERARAELEKLEKETTTIGPASLYVCVYAGVTIRDGKGREEAIQHLIGLINQLAEEGLIKGQLVQLSSLDVLRYASPLVLVKPSENDPAFGVQFVTEDPPDECIFSFFHVPSTVYEEVKARSPYLAAAEGCLPPFWDPAQ